MIFPWYPRHVCLASIMETNIQVDIIRKSQYVVDVEITRGLQGRLAHAPHVSGV